MKESLFNKFITALRSGKYKQTTGNLAKISEEKVWTDHGICSEVNYCALGVLAEVSSFKRSLDGDNITFNGEDSTLNEYMRKKIGLPQSIHDEIFQLNDDGASFRKIATFLEKNKKKFVKKAS